MTDKAIPSEIKNKDITSPLAEVSPFESATIPGNFIDVEINNPLSNVENTDSITKSSSTNTLKPVESSGSLTNNEISDEPVSEGAVKDPLTPTPSTSTFSMIKSTSSNSSDLSIDASICTLTAESGPQIQNVVDEEPGVATSASQEHQEGWSEEDNLDLDKTSSDQDSRSSLDLNEHKRCLSIGSTTSSSILMLQSPHESCGDKSDEKSDEDNTKTPTILAIQPSTKLELTHETISEEVHLKPVPSRMITSPTHSDKSDMQVLHSEDASKPDNNEMMKLKEILHAREQRLFKMNQEYVEVQDELLNERQRSHTLEQNLNILSQKHSMAVEELEEEFGAMEELKINLEEELDQLKRAGDIEELKRELDERDQLIDELTIEGEKLSQSSFNSANNVKKLRQKEKEDEKVIKDKTDKIDALSNGIDDLKTKIKILEKSVSEGAQNISELNIIIKTQSENLVETRTKLENRESEHSSLKHKVDDYLKQIATLKEQNCLAESKASKQSLSANIKAREEAQAAVDELKAVSEATIKQQSSQIGELHEVIGRLEQQATWREQRHRDQTQELHTRVEDADGRNQDISTSITASTQPLLRQMQLYKESLKNQQITWEAIEADLKEKLERARSDLSDAEIEKRELSDKLQLAKNKIFSVQTQFESVRSERNELEVKVEVTLSKLMLLEEERRKDTTKSDVIKSQYVDSLEDSRKDCEKLREDLLLSQSLVRELETTKSVMSEVEDIASRSSTPPIDYASQTSILERSLFGSITPSSPTYSVQSFSPYGMEKLQSQLKQSQVRICFKSPCTLKHPYFSLTIIHIFLQCAPTRNRPKLRFGFGSEIW